METLASSGVAPGAVFRQTLLSPSFKGCRPTADSAVVAVDLAAPRAEEPTRALALSISARAVLAGIVAASFAIRWLAALLHTTPQYFPDEYIYASLARSIAESRSLEIRGAPASFPALLEPLLTAPFWLAGDPELAYRLTQGVNALAMSLAAIPVYLLCRRLGLSTRFALVAGALAVASPALLYVSFITADAIAYPLVLGAVYAGVRALERPTARAQVAFVGLSGLAAFARVQYVLLPAAFVVTALAVERARIRTVARRFRVSLGLFAIPALGVLVAGPARLLGYYKGVADLGIDLGEIAHWVATDAMLLAYSAGWVIVPGAAVGLVFALARARAREERAFAALVGALGVGVFAQAALYATNGSDRFQERYFMTLLPLVAPAFGLYLARGAPARRVTALIALALLALAARVPLAEYTVSVNKQDSPFLLAVFQLELELGVGEGSLVVALLAGALSLLAAAVAFRRRLAPVALAATLVAACATSVGAIAFDAFATNVIRDAGARDLRWVDHANVGPVSLLQTPASPRPLALEQLFWNTSIEEMLLFDFASPIDAFRSPRVKVAADGRLVGVSGRTVSNALLVSTYAVQMTFTDARLVARAGAFELWDPRGDARVSTLVSGRWREGWLARSGSVTVWPDRSRRAEGTLRFELSLPANAQRTALQLKAPGDDRTISIAPGERHAFTYKISTREPWTLRYGTSRPGYLNDGRLVSVQATRPTFVRRNPSGPAPRAATRASSACCSRSA